ncbi:DUF4013 domain-containing protein [Haloarculaceae archaeon H-GB11]|nr:DUF4013 domain-containing protein [Haloarculaceae archaeon H-GB11]
MGALMGGVGIGVVLLLFVVSLLVGVFTLGYNVRVLRTTAEGDDELPRSRTSVGCSSTGSLEW